MKEIVVGIALGGGGGAGGRMCNLFYRADYLNVLNSSPSFSNNRGRTLSFPVCFSGLKLPFFSEEPS